MSNPEHLRIIHEGSKKWNSWKATTRAIPNLRCANLREAQLHGVNLIGADLQGADLMGADLSQAHLTEADLSYAFLKDANLSRATIVSANLSEATLREATLDSARIIEANLTEADLRDADLRRANLSGSNLSGANLRGADLRNSELVGVNFSRGKLEKANLAGADLRGANLGKTGLTHSNLSRAILNEANLDEANLSGADLSEASLIGATFVRTDLSEADLSRATLGHTTFGDNDLSTVKGLSTTRHLGPSTVGIDTLFRSSGKIPEIFLREAGVPEDFITFIPSLVGQAIQFYSCFISYSHKDEQFSHYLHARMRSENLRVWYAPEDMKGGRKLHEEIFRAIQIHDKLLLVLSENSMKSEWVITEIRRARKVEHEEKRRKLFPIRLVDFKTIEKWECFDADAKKDMAIEVREYYIPDFSNWKDHDAFESAFAKLFRDLRATEK